MRLIGRSYLFATLATFLVAAGVGRGAGGYVQMQAAPEARLRARYQPRIS